jgi:hypothetical protein
MLVVDPVTVLTIEPGEEVTVYWVIALPPLEGAIQLTVACLSPATADTEVGAPGTVPLTVATGVTGDEGVDVALLPMALLATTVNV